MKIEKAMNRFRLLFLLAGASLAGARELPLPQIPAGLQQPEERADYLLEHFWDGMDFSDAEAICDTAFIEGSFANFASVMPHASKAGHEAAVVRLMNAAEASPGAPALLVAVAERYLYEPQSPVYCEDCFEPFARYAVANDVDVERMKLLLEDMGHSAPGTAAPALRLVLAGKKEVSLQQLMKPAKPTLLMFYDSGCDGCRRLATALDGDEGFSRCVAQGRMNVIAVNLAEENIKAPIARMPSEWIMATACDAQDARNAYALRSTPALYLVGADGRIALKNATLPCLGRYLRWNLGN